MLRGSDDDYFCLASPPHCPRHFFHFLFCVHDRIRKDMDYRFRNAFVDQDFAAVFFFADITNSKLFQFAGRTRWATDPHLGG